ncbi:MAG: hypothetical protein RR495_01005 [Anaerovoracaceae bacterium]
MNKKKVADLIGKLLGDKNEIEKRFANVYGKGDFNDKVNLIQKDLRYKYILVAILFLVLLIGSIASNTGATPKVIKNSEGNIKEIFRPLKKEESKKLSIKVTAISPKGTFKKDTVIYVDPKSSNLKNGENEIVKDEPIKSQIDREIMGTIRNINANTRNNRILLPTTLKDGTRLLWSENKEKNFMIFIALALIFIYMIYYSRYEKIKKEEKLTRDSVIICLPEYINKLILLLGAGIVFDSCFKKINNDYKNVFNGEKVYFYEQLIEVENIASETNCTIENAFGNFSKRVQIKELLRVTNIISDSVVKGTELKDKLELEGQALWFARKKNSEEKGRLAETKLTIPLVILLMVLVMITVAPAMMQM